MQENTKMIHRKLFNQAELKAARDHAAKATKNGAKTPRPYNMEEGSHTQEKLTALLKQKAEILERLARQAEEKGAADQKIEEEAKAVLIKAKEQLAEEKEKDQMALAEARARYATALGKGYR